MKEIASCGRFMKSKGIGVLREASQCPSDGELSMGRKKCISVFAVCVLHPAS